MKVKAGDEKSITVHADRDLFGRLLIVANARRPFLGKFVEHVHYIDLRSSLTICSAEVPQLKMADRLAIK